MKDINKLNQLILERSKSDGINYEEIFCEILDRGFIKEYNNAFHHFVNDYFHMLTDYCVIRNNIYDAERVSEILDLIYHLESMFDAGN